ncbi:MAG TPA: fumarylacetoacetate hydrolase family protein [Dehalococcoidia bacterium]|nr:fumarylacetoacetate hydrolase family protein [Dehalococcoidia bacterium]
MRYVRFEQGGQVRHGIVEGDSVRSIDGDLFGRHEVTGKPTPLGAVKLLAPVMPGKVLATAVNYHSHVAQSRAVLNEDEAPKQPELFYKPTSCIIGPEEAVIRPASYDGRLDAEGEMVAVIGKRASKVSPEEALGYVFGYTCGNDVSARQWQRGDIQWWRAKGSDTFGALGPWIETDLDPTNVELRTRVNGKELQSTNTNLMVHNVAKLVSFISGVVTLEPGDIIYTGTPGETPELQPGDTVEVEIQGIGVLKNPVQAG